ncbi:MAG: hypothetical protein ACKVVT_16365 [Dehalococcoidia bacterium]
MSSREALHQLVSALPEASLDEAEHLLRRCNSSSVPLSPAATGEGVSEVFEYEDEELSPAELRILADRRAGRLGPSVLFTQAQIEALIAAASPTNG